MIGQINNILIIVVSLQLIAVGIRALVNYKFRLHVPRLRFSDSIAKTATMKKKWIPLIFKLLSNLRHRQL